MKIAFAGKGGSGKTTLSSLFTRYLAAQGLPAACVGLEPAVRAMEQGRPFRLGDLGPDALAVPAGLPAVAAPAG